VVGIEDDALYQQQAIAQVECVLGTREQCETMSRILRTMCEPEKPEQYGGGVGVLWMYLREEKMLCFTL